MDALADSDAYKDADRTLVQHQSALTLLQLRLSDPAAETVRWLDLACGRGQIISDLGRNLSEKARSKLEYWAYDIDKRFALEAETMAARLGFASVRIEVGDLRVFDKILPSEVEFDFITLTNTVHEVAPRRLAAILIGAVLRLSETGTLFVYDMERLRPPELGAVPWSGEEMARIVRKLLDTLGESEYQPEIGRWRHRTCDAWNLILQRRFLRVSREEALERREAADQAMGSEIAQLLTSKLEACRKALEELTRYGAQTAEEQEAKERYLFEFWAVTRALEEGR